MSLGALDNLTWQQLYDHTENKQDIKILDRLIRLLQIDDVIFLLEQIFRLNKADEIKILNSYQEKQHKLGGWVTGLLPAQFTSKEIIVPDTFSNQLKCMLQLAEQKSENIEAVKAIGEYNLNFKRHNFEFDSSSRFYPDNWNLEIDLTVMRETLDFIGKHGTNREKALMIAKLEANQQMLQHRRNLGYLPEPITDTDDLASLLIWAASDRPVDLIWKWLHPMNIFELADLYNYQQEFNNLYENIHSTQDQIKSKVLSTINKYIKIDLTFKEIFSLTVGFAIRGWATDIMFGVNIENIKDDYDKLISTIAHELFHRLQTIICSKDKKENTFNDIVSSGYSDERDNKFYEALSYIMIEGTGEFISHQIDSKNNGDLLQKAKEGIGLLENIYGLIYKQADLEKADELLGQGLRANGVFYSLGEYITKYLINEKGDSYLGEILLKGVLDFFIEGIETSTNLDLDERVLYKIKEMIKIADNI